MIWEMRARKSLSNSTHVGVLKLTVSLAPNFSHPQRITQNNVNPKGLHPGHLKVCLSVWWKLQTPFPWKHLKNFFLLLVSRRSHHFFLSPKRTEILWMEPVNTSNCLISSQHVFIVHLLIHWINISYIYWSS